MKRFYLERIEDESGVSGVRIIAEGVEFGDGSACMKWLVVPGWLNYYEGGIKAIEAVHGHRGKTRVMVIDNNE